MNKFHLLVLFLILVQVAFADDYLFDSATIDDKANQFMNTQDSKISMIIPAILLIVVLVSFAIDFGTVGVCLAAIGSLVVLYFIGIIAISLTALVSFVLMGGILIFKISNT